MAVKVVRADLATDPEFRARFQREVAVAHKVSGPFTAPVIDADTDGPEPWLATSYVAGPSLADAVSEHGPLPAASVLELAAGLAEGLCAIHAASVVHRDLKPSNVLLAEDGPRVIDFGISVAAETSPLTRLGMVVGSPGFMSPEQAEGRDVGPSSDIFSLGAVLAFAATGEGPFGTGSAPTLAYRVVYSPPSLEAVPADVRPLIESCLDKDPGRRRGYGPAGWHGHVPPATGWLPEPMTRTFAQQPPAPTALDTAPAYGRTAEAPAAAGPINPMTVTVARLTPPWGQAPVPPPRRERRRRGRPLAIAALVTGLLAASAAGGIALAASAHPSASLHSGQAAPPPAATAPVTSAPPTSAPASTPAATASTSSPAAQPSSMSPSVMPSATMSAPVSSPSPTPSGSQAPAPSQTPAPASSGSPAPSRIAGAGLGIGVGS